MLHLGMTLLVRRQNQLLLSDIIIPIIATEIPIAYYDDSDSAFSGVLEVGKLADFVVLDQDIFSIDPTSISTTKVLYTYLGGEMIYDHHSPAILVPG